MYVYMSCGWYVQACTFTYLHGYTSHSQHVCSHFCSSTAQHNKSVKSKILEEISSVPNNTHPENSIRGMYVYIKLNMLYLVVFLTAAVQRKYEYMRRLFTLEETQDCDAVKKETALKKKYRQRRKRVCDSTCVHV